jgi:uncharacterized protein
VTMEPEATGPLQADGGTAMKTRLRADLGTAMKRGLKHDVMLIRGLIAAIDNAAAAPVRNEPVLLTRHDFGRGSAEGQRLVLGRDQVRALLAREIDARAEAAAEFTRLGETERADILAAEIRLTRRYLDQA